MDNKIGLALGAGAARGFAHIGVIKALEAEKIPVYCIAGCSMGALIGGLYARGMDIETIEGLSCGLDHRKWLDLGVPRKGLIRGKKITEILRLMTRDYNIEELKTPFACIATDIQNGEEVVIKEGNLAEAIRASISVPGVFVPYQDAKSRMLVDGAVINRVPINVCRELGADIVLAVDVDYQVERVEVNNIFDIILQTMSIMQKEIMNYKLGECDYIIKPDLKDLKSTQFERARYAIDAGRSASHEAVHEIKARLKKEKEKDE